MKASRAMKHEGNVFTISVADLKTVGTSATLYLWQQKWKTLRTKLPAAVGNMH